MKEKLERDANAAKGSKRLILATGIVLVMVAIIYSTSILAGGAFYDFCAGAIQWVVLGIGVAFAMAYMRQKG